MSSPEKPIKPAATVLLLRDTEDTPENGPEVFMVVRHHQIDFASGALVFPGGKVDPGDYESELANYVPDSNDPMLAFKIASIRESFEEANVFLAREKSNGKLVAGDHLQLLADKYRQDLLDDKIDILTVVKAENLELATDLLVHFAHWITPDHMPKQFDTHFYIARVPENQLAVHDGEESVDSVWIHPDAALEGNKDGTYTIVFPTRMNVEKLAKYRTVSEALEGCAANEVVTVKPWITKTDDGMYLNIPADAGYSLTQTLIDSKRGLA